MEQWFNLNSEIFAWVILPILIFLSRVMDVSIGTIRIIFVSRGKKYLAPLLGFFEVLVWIVAMGQIMQNLNNIVCYITYAAGFAVGTFVGIFIEEKLAIGMMVVRIIVVKGDCRLTESLSEAGYGVTTVDAKGRHGEVKLIYTIIKRKDLDNVIKIVNNCNSKAFYSIEDARNVNQGIFPRCSATCERKRIFNVFNRYEIYKKK